MSSESVKPPIIRLYKENENKENLIYLARKEMTVKEIYFTLLKRKVLNYASRKERNMLYFQEKEIPRLLLHEIIFTFLKVNCRK